MIKGAIFDFDGTLADSMGIWTGPNSVDCQILRQNGYAPDTEYFETIKTKNFKDGMRYVKERYGLEGSLEEISELFRQIANAFYQNVTLKPGAKELLERYRREGVKMAIVTTCIRPLCETALRANGVLDYFDVFVYADEVGLDKNTPEIYLVAAGQLGVDPADCIVFEDAFHGIVSAKEAGMTAIAVYDSSAAKDAEALRQVCDRYVMCLEDFEESLT